MKNTKDFWEAIKEKISLFRGTSLNPKYWYFLLRLFNFSNYSKSKTRADLFFFREVMQFKNHFSAKKSTNKSYQKKIF